MKKLLFSIFICSISKTTFAQSDPQKLIDGGKTLIELIKIIKTPKASFAGARSSSLNPSKSLDSCLVKQRTDLCFKNLSNRTLSISLYIRTDTGYDARPFLMRVLISKEECWYELKAGIYRYKIEEDLQGTFVLYREGEMKLQACENMQRTITE